jgi:hypothetical protein
MAPKKPSETVRSNKIRFVLVEADVSDQNLSELTAAITSALKPQVRAPQLPPKFVAPELPAGGNDVPVEELELAKEGVEVEEGAEPNNGSEPKPSRPKKFKPPVYIAALVEGEKGKSFKEFATTKAPSSKSKKYLVAAYWLKEQGEATVNADKIYTCFKTAGWGTGFNDWSQTFHNLVHTEHMRKEGTAEFALNPLGEDAVTKGTE